MTYPTRSSGLASEGADDGQRDSCSAAASSTASSASGHAFSGNRDRK
ncbi:MAG TPA: hypothetical protein VN969_09970 [Streptosporangiaceae bacterium]|nr:hypothetical protein [Streptosporangiaceae bacterium]